MWRAWFRETAQKHREKKVRDVRERREFTSGSSTFSVGARQEKRHDKSIPLAEDGRLKNASRSSSCSDCTLVDITLGASATLVVMSSSTSGPPVSSKSGISAISWIPSSSDPLSYLEAPILREFVWTRVRKWNGNISGIKLLCGFPWASVDHLLASWWGCTSRPTPFERTFSSYRQYSYCVPCPCFGREVGSPLQIEGVAFSENFCQTSCCL